MKQFKKAVSLIAVLAFLITALIPVSGLAQTAQPTIIELTTVTGGALPVAVIAPASGTTWPTSDINMYVWKGTEISKLTVASDPASLLPEAAKVYGVAGAATIDSAPTGDTPQKVEGTVSTAGSVELTLTPAQTVNNDPLYIGVAQGTAAYARIKVIPVTFAATATSSITPTGQDNDVVTVTVGQQLTLTATPRYTIPTNTEVTISPAPTVSYQWNNGDDLEEATNREYTFTPATAAAEATYTCTATITGAGDPVTADPMFKVTVKNAPAITEVSSTPINVVSGTAIAATPIATPVELDGATWKLVTRTGTTAPFQYTDATFATDLTFAVAEEGSNNGKLTIAIADNKTAGVAAALPADGTAAEYYIAATLNGSTVYSSTPIKLRNATPAINVPANSSVIDVTAGTAVASTEIADLFEMAGVTGWKLQTRSGSSGAYSYVDKANVTDNVTLIASGNKLSLSIATDKSATVAQALTTAAAGEPLYVTATKDAHTVASAYPVKLRNATVSKLSFNDASEAKTSIYVSASIAADTTESYTVEWGDTPTPAGATYTWTGKTGVLEPSSNTTPSGTLTNTMKVVGPGTASLQVTASTGQSTDPLDVTVYQFGVDPATAKVQKAETGTVEVPVNIKWTPSKPTAANSAAVNITGDASGTIDAGANSGTISVDATATGAKTCTLTTTVDGTPVTATFTVNVEESVAADNAEGAGAPTEVTPSEGENPTELPDGTEIPAGTDVAAYDVTVTDQQVDDDVVTQLAVTPVLGSEETTYKWSAAPATFAGITEANAANSNKGTNTVAIPTTAGIYQIAAEVKNGDTTSVVYYTVTMAGDLGANNTGADEEQQASVVADPTGDNTGTVELFPSWDNPNVTNGLGAPSEDQKVVYVWSTTTPGGQVSPTTPVSADTPVTYTGTVPGVATVKAYACWNDPQTGNRAANNPADLIAQGNINIGKAADVSFSVGSTENATQAQVNLAGAGETVTAKDGDGDPIPSGVWGIQANDNNVTLGELINETPITDGTYTGASITLQAKKGVKPGNYTLTFTSAPGQPAATLPVKVNAPNYGTATISGPSVLLIGPKTSSQGSYNLSWSGGTAPAPGDVTYRWTVSNNAEISGSSALDTATVDPTNYGAAQVSVTATDTWTQEPIAVAPIPVNIYEFALRNAADSVIPGSSGTTVNIAPYWVGNTPPEGMVTFTVPTLTLTNGVFPINVTSGTPSATYEVTATATSGAVAKADYQLNVLGSISDATITVQPDSGSVEWTSEDAPSGYSAAQYAVINDELYQADRGYFTVTNLLVGSNPARYAVTSVLPTDASVQAIDGTNRITLPTRAGIYRITVTATDGDNEVRSLFTVVMQGVLNVGNSVSPTASENANGGNQFRIENGTGVWLYTRWNEDWYIGAPASGEAVTYSWSVDPLPSSNGQDGTLTATDGPNAYYTNHGGNDRITVVAKAQTPDGTTRIVGQQTISTNDLQNTQGSYVDAFTSSATDWTPVYGSNMMYAVQGAPNSTLASGATDNGRLPALNAANAWNSISGRYGDAVSTTTMTVKPNSRFEIMVPDAFWTNGSVPGTTANTYYEWQYRTRAGQAGGNSYQIPTGEGFYGVDSPRLTSTPVTPSMDGWAFRLVRRETSGNTTTYESPWVTLSVEDADRVQEVPSVTVTSVPVSEGGNVSVAETGDVTFSAAVQSGLESASLGYQWYSRPAPTASAPNPTATAIEGATSSTYKITNAAAALDGTTYYCVVSNNSFEGIEGTSNSLTLHVNAADGAVIISSPSAASLLNLFASRTATFSVEAKTDNGDAVTYQWFKKGTSAPVKVGGVIKNAADAAAYLAQRPVSEVPIDGATSATYTTPALEEGVYEYVCRVTNATKPAQTQRSAGFYLVVTQESRRPNIETPKAPAGLNWQFVGTPEGQPVTFTCDAKVQSGEALTYQWEASQNQNGPYSALNGATSSTFTITAPTGSNNGWWYRCKVTNAAAELTEESLPQQLNVWNTQTVPVTGATTPANFTGTTGSTPVTFEISSTATVPSGDPLSAEWFVGDVPLQSIINNWYALGGQDCSINTSATNGMYTSKVQIRVPVTNGPWQSALIANFARALSGDWTCRWTNTNTNVATTANLSPFKNSGTCAVDVQVPSWPEITVQPKDTTAAVGQTVTFSVGARLNESQNASPKGTPVYVWQRSEDGGNTWKNCTSSDGSGQFTSTFTINVTQAMYDYATAANVQGFANPYTFRVNVGNRTTGYNVYSTPSTGVELTITAGSEQPTPVIKPAEGVDLTIADNTELGKILSGGALVVNKDGHKASEVVGMVTFEPANDAYALRVVKPGAEGAEDTVLTDDQIVGTGCEIRLINTADGDKVLDRVTVIVRGDVIGNGVISLTQLVRMAAGFKDPAALTGAYMLAGDMNNSAPGTIELTDLVREAAIYRAEILDAANPTPAPTTEPSTEPTTAPTTEPSAEPTATPSTEPSAEPTTQPSGAPTAAPTESPSEAA